MDIAIIEQEIEPTVRRSGRSRNVIDNYNVYNTQRRLDQNIQVSTRSHRLAVDRRRPPSGDEDEEDVEIYLTRSWVPTIRRQIATEDQLIDLIGSDYRKKAQLVDQHMMQICISLFGKHLFAPPGVLGDRFLGLYYDISAMLKTRSDGDFIGWQTNLVSVRNEQANPQEFPKLFQLVTDDVLKTTQFFLMERQQNVRHKRFREEKTYMACTINTLAPFVIQQFEKILIQDNSNYEEIQRIENPNSTSPYKYFLHHRLESLRSMITHPIICLTCAAGLVNRSTAMSHVSKYHSDYINLAEWNRVKDMRINQEREEDREKIASLKHHHDHYHPECNM